MQRPLLLFFVQHLLGIGHLHRALRIASACIAQGFRVQLVSGGHWPQQLKQPPGLELIQLPPLSAADTGFSGLVGLGGNAPDRAYWHDRQQKLLALNEQQPDIVLFELFPFGRRQLRHELLGWLDALHQQPKRPLCVSSVRDILVRKQDPEKALARETQMRQWFQDHFDYALIHGDPDFIRFDDTFPQAAAIAAQIQYTGLVCPPAPQPEPRRAIVVSCGGGAVGQNLLQTAIAAQKIDGLGQEWELYTGPNLAKEARTSLQPGPGVSIQSYHPNLCQRLAGARLSVSQAGYNTVADLLISGTDGVLIPFAEGGESEQTLRAEALFKHGRFEMVRESALTPESLLAAIRRALKRDAASTPFTINTDGARQSAEQLWQWLKQR